MSFVVLVALSLGKDDPLKKPTDVPATVIAHLSLPQATGNQMLLQREEGKNYLYVQQASRQGFMIVDVSKPEKPNLLKRTAESNQATAGSLEMVSPDVAIAESPEKKTHYSHQQQSSHGECAGAGSERPAQSKNPSGI